MLLEITTIIQSKEKTALSNLRVLTIYGAAKGGAAFENKPAEHKPGCSVERGVYELNDTIAIRPLGNPKLFWL